MIIRDENGIAQVFSPQPALIRRNDWRFLKMKDAVNGSIDSQILLELGPGQGEFTNRWLTLNPKSMELVEESEFFCNELKNNFRQNENVKVHHFRWPSDYWELGPFDCIVGNGFLHHQVHCLSESLQQINKALKPGGTLLFWEPNLKNPLVFMIFRFPFLRRFVGLDPTEMAILFEKFKLELEDSGFENVEILIGDWMLPVLPSNLVSISAVIFHNLNRIRWLKAWAPSILIRATKPN